MKNARIALATIMLLSLAAGAALAGGMAQVSVIKAPKQVVAGEKFEIAFTVTPMWPMAKNRTLEPTVKAACGDRAITLAAVPLKKAGQFTASFAVPAAGEWVITVDSRYCETQMKPLVLTAQPGKDTQS